MSSLTDWSRFLAQFVSIKKPPFSDTRFTESLINKTLPKIHSGKGARVSQTGFTNQSLINILIAEFVRLNVNGNLKVILSII